MYLHLAGTEAMFDLLFKLYLHHEEDGRHDESRIGGVCKNGPYESW